MARLYALLVGINEYSVPAHNLQGCVNDMQAWHSYLIQRAEQTGYELHAKTLKNREATRQAVIDGFLHHLALADKDDLVFFFFAGHGSQEDAPECFWGIEPDHLNETLVCYDSRTENGLDLADKELSSLIAVVAQMAPYITVVLDCCHAGSGSRELDERRINKRNNHSRPLESYFLPTTRSQTDYPTRGSQPSDQSFQLLKGRHVLLAACQDRQTAKEFNIGTGRRGIFSYCMLDKLMHATHEFTYEELLTLVRHEVQRESYEQVPQLEIIEGNRRDRQRYFLGTDVEFSQSTFTLSYTPQKGWVIDGGGVDGWPEGKVEQELEFSIFPYSSSMQQLEVGSGQIATAHAYQVNATTSQVTIKATTALKQVELYKALLLKSPQRPLSVYLAGQDQGIGSFRDTLKQLEPSRVHVKEVSNRDEADAILQIKGQTYDILRGSLLGGPTQIPMASFSYSSIPPDLESPLAHIAYWKQLRELDNSQKVGLIPRDGVQLQFLYEGERLDTEEISLAYQYIDRQWIAPKVGIRLLNNTSIRLYCAVLDLSAQFSINPDLLVAGGVWLDPHTSIDVQQGRFAIPEVFRTQGATEYQDIFKLIVSTEWFNARRHAQGSLSKCLDNANREFESDEPLLSQSDWMVRDWVITINKPSEQALLTEDEDYLLKELGKLVESDRSPGHTDRPIGRRDETVSELSDRSPGHTDRPIGKLGQSETEWADNLLGKGQAEFQKLSPQVYELLCSPIGEDDSELARELTKLFEQKTVDAATKAVKLLSPLLVSKLGLPQSIALILSTLMIKKVANSTSNLICANWKESLRL